MALYPSGLSDSARKSTFELGATTRSSATERARTRLDDFLRSGTDVGARRVGEPLAKSAKTDDFELRQLKAKVRELEAASLNHRAQTLKAEQERDQLRLELEREKLEREADRKSRHRDVEEHAEVVSDLERQRRFLLDREETLSAQVKELEAQTTKLRKSTNERVRQAEEDKQQLEQKLAEVQHASLNSTKGHFELEVQRAQQEVTTWREHGESLQKELEQTQQRAHKAEAKLDQLQFDQGEVSRLRQALETRTQQINELKTQLGSPQQMQASDARRLRRLEAENKHFKQTIENEALTKEKLLQCQGQLKRAQEQLAGEQRRNLSGVDPSMSTTGWEALMTQLGLNSSGGLTSADDVVRYVAQMQQDLAVLRHSHQALTKDSKHLSATSASQQAELEAATQQLEELQVTLQETQRQAQRDANRIAFLKRELESVRSVGQAYEQQAMSFAKDSSPVLEAKVQGLEAQLTHVKTRNEALEEELRLLANGGSSDVTSTRYMDYDPSTTKVVGLKVTPLTMHKQEQAQLVQTLREENQALIAQLGETNPAANLSVATASSRETELQTKLEGADKRLQRLKEVFQKNVKDFRSACYELTGYTLEVTTVDGGVRYNLHSMYAERAADVLLFQSTPTGMQLLESDFARQWRSEIEHYLGKLNSIPGFLSAVTQELLSRSTVAM
eukprot:m.125909 g.125909  ORF g.125909 m.125909 type:complete len:676 (-) comp15762_c0_seq1:1491-3518(-)